MVPAIGSGTPRGPSGSRGPSDGSVTLEWLLVLPVLALAVTGLLEVGSVVRDALLVHDAARVGVRAAVTSSGDGEVAPAVAAVLADRGHRVEVAPHTRRDGDLVRVTVTLDRSLGPASHRLEASAVGRTEPVVGGADPPGTPPVPVS